MSTIDFPRPELHPGEWRELSPGEWAAACADQSLQAFRSVLEAIRNRVLVVAADIPAAQRKEINRELSIMHWQLEEARRARALPDFPGTVHLVRERRA